MKKITVEEEKRSLSPMRKFFSHPLSFLATKTKLGAFSIPLSFVIQLLVIDKSTECN